MRLGTVPESKGDGRNRSPAEKTGKTETKGIQSAPLTGPGQDGRIRATGQGRREKARLALFLFMEAQGGRAPEEAREGADGFPGMKDTGISGKKQADGRTE